MPLAQSGLKAVKFHLDPAGELRKDGAMIGVWRITGFLAFVAAFALAVWVWSFARSLEELERRGQSDLSLATDSLTQTLASYRQLAVSLAGDPRIEAEDTSRDALVAELLRVADLSGAFDLVLLGQGGDVLASASGTEGFEWTRHSLVTQAFQGTVGRDLLVTPELGRRIFLYAVPVFSEAGPVLRVLTVLIDLERVETDFRGSNPAVLMSNAAGRVYFSNRSELVLSSRAALLGETERGPVSWLARTWAEVTLWRVSAGRYLPRWALHIPRDLPVIGLQAEALVDAAPAFRTAGLQAAVALIGCLLFGLVITFIASQRKALARANEVLEGRVAERTRELSDANTALRAEVVERTEAERALKRTQDALIQSGKLSALGKMSAGISHELNQPLMAIRSFSENAETFLKRGEPDKAAANLGRIGALSHRMGRIIRNLRAFARQEGETMGAVDLVTAVDAAIDLAETRLREENVTLVRDIPDVPIWVLGGEVRLQQVVLNLITNAVDAMAGLPERRIDIEVRQGERVRLSVSDTGPGLSEPDKVFEPFYSTKSIGEAEGVGLGLSISYGLVQSFGGDIQGRNAKTGGAVFEVELMRGKEAAE